MKSSVRLHFQLMTALGIFFSLPCLIAQAATTTVAKTAAMPVATPVVTKAATTPTTTGETKTEAEKADAEAAAERERKIFRPSGADVQDILELLEGQINALQQSDINKAYTAYASMQFKDKTALNEFQYFIESYPSFSKNRNAFFAGMQFKKNYQAVIQGVLSAITNETLKVEYDLIKENGQWRILNIQILRPKNPVEQELPAPQR
jgi:Domain of unknown function (DUF4864)